MDEMEGIYRGTFLYHLSFLGIERERERERIKKVLFEGDSFLLYFNFWDSSLSVDVINWAFGEIPMPT